MRLRHVVPACFLVATVFAQSLPPRGKASMTVRGKEVVIDYGQPALKGRKIDALLSGLPPDRIWRAGMNQVTTLTAGVDLMIGGKRLPAGKYSLFVHAPASGDWSLVLNKDLGIELGKFYPAASEAMKNELWPNIIEGYAKIAGQEVVRVPLKSGTPAAPVDLFTIALQQGDAGSMLVLSWGDKSWSVDVRPA